MELSIIQRIFIKKIFVYLSPENTFTVSQLSATMHLFELAISLMIGLFKLAAPFIIG